MQKYSSDDLTLNPVSSSDWLSVHVLEQPFSILMFFSVSFIIYSYSVNVLNFCVNSVLYSTELNN
jgi:hypothetical protein